LGADSQGNEAVVLAVVEGVDIVDIVDIVEVVEEIEELDRPPWSRGWPMTFSRLPVRWYIEYNRVWIYQLIISSLGI
jgi:hypothetical protein